MVIMVAFKGERNLIVSHDFGAYYTHIATNDAFEKKSRTGDYADIIVDLGKENGKFMQYTQTHAGFSQICADKEPI